MKSRLKITLPVQSNHQNIHANEFICTSKSSKMSNNQQNSSPRRASFNSEQKIGYFGRNSVCVINCNNNNIYCHSNGNIHGGNISTSSSGTNNNNSTMNSQKNMNNSDNQHTNSDHLIWYAYAFISFVAIGCYVNGINGDFVHDDIPAITLNKDVTGSNKITRSFFNDFWGTPMDDANSHKSYRPLTVLSFR